MVLLCNHLLWAYRKNVCPFLFLENSRPLSSPWEPQTGFSSLGTPDFLSTCLGIDCLTLSSPSRGCLALLQLLLLEWYHVHIWGCWYFSWQSWFQRVIHPAWILHDILWTEVKGTWWQYTTFSYSLIILNHSVVPYLVLTVSSWSTYRFLRRQVRWPGTPINWRISHSLLRSTQSKALV